MTMTVIAESFSAFARSLLAARPSKSSVIVPSASWSWKVSVSVHAWEFDVALVHALLGAHLVVDLLDVDRRDVVGEQHELVREDVVLVLVLQGLGQDGAELQQAHHKRSRTREGLAQASGLNTRGAYQRQLADSWRYGENRAVSGQKRSWELLTAKRMCRPSDASALSSPSPRYRLHQRSQCQRAFRQKVFVAPNGSARSLSQLFGQ